MNRVTRPTSVRRGIATTWMALILVAGVGFVGIGIDVGYIWLVGHQLQNAADGAALAAARQVRGDITAGRNAAITIALANTAANTPVQLDANAANDPVGDIVVGTYHRPTRTFTPRTTAVRAVKVVARRLDTHHGPVSLLFGPIFSVDTAQASRYAIAMLTGGGDGAGIITLNPTDACAFHIQGNAYVDANEGGIQVNSSNDCAFCVTGNSAGTSVPEIMVVGEACIGPNFDFEGILTTAAEPILDPLAALPPPTWDPNVDMGCTVNPQCRVMVVGGETITLSPGYYSQGITANAGTVNLQSGIYVLDGAGIDVAGIADLFAPGVLLYIIGTGDVNLSGTGIVEISAMTSGPYEGISLWNSTTNESTINGTDTWTIEGTLYFPSSHLRVGGTAQQFGNQIIAWTLLIFGDDYINVDYDARNPGPPPHVFLVE